MVLSRLTPDLALSMPTLLLTGLIIVPCRRTGPPPPLNSARQPSHYVPTDTTTAPRRFDGNTFIIVADQFLSPPPFPPRDPRIGVFRLGIFISLWTSGDRWLLFLMGCCGHSSTRTVFCSVMALGGGGVCVWMDWFVRLLCWCIMTNRSGFLCYSMLFCACVCVLCVCAIVLPVVVVWGILWKNLIKKITTTTKSWTRRKITP